MRTLIDNRKDAADILVEYANGGSFTLKLQNNVDLGNRRGIKATYENGMIEVTTKKLDSLSKLYKVECNF